MKANRGDGDGALISSFQLLLERACSRDGQMDLAGDGDWADGGYGVCYGGRGHGGEPDYDKPWDDTGYGLRRRA